MVFKINNIISKLLANIVGGPKVHLTTPEPEDGPSLKSSRLWNHDQLWGGRGSGGSCHTGRLFCCL